MAGEQNGGGAGDKRWPPVRLPPAMYEQLRQAAGENQRSVAGEARYALSLYLRQVERRKAASS